MHERRNGKDGKFQHMNWFVFIVKFLDISYISNHAFINENGMNLKAFSVFNQKAFKIFYE